MGILLVEAEYAYEAASENELSLEKGVKIVVHSQDASGWWEGIIEETGARGYFPSTYVTVIEQFDEKPSIQPVSADTSAIDVSRAIGGTPKGGQSAGVFTTREEAVAAVIPRPDAPEITIESSHTRYGVWASYMGIGAAQAFLISGFVSIIWFICDAQEFRADDLVVGIYAIFAGCAVWYFESKWVVRTPSNFPFRGIGYTAIAIPGLFRLVTAFAAGHLVICGLVHTYSASKSEQFHKDWATKAEVKKSGPNTKKSKNLCDRIMRFKEKNATGTIVFLGVYVLINIYVAASALNKWIKIVDTLHAIDPKIAPSYWAPYAKLFGNLLDLNCGVLLLPVCRTFIRHLYDLSTQSQELSQRWLRAILYFIPLDKSLEFHMLLAWWVLICAIAHAFFHLVNYGIAPKPTMEIFGLAPWVTGVAIFMLMMFMYGAVPIGVKRFHFEIFWYSHQCFVGFFSLLLIHGANYWNPNVWKWLVLPGFIYILERIYRYRSAYRAVKVTGITVMDNVYCVEFEKESAFPNGYKEGQYVFLNCPHLSSGQWHPFTISSAPQESQVSLHIRIMKEGSWTWRLAQYLSLMVPKGSSHISFLSSDMKSGGKVMGPDGKQILRIYGPHSAPTQHISEYSTAMVTASGIGVTPLCASLKSIVQHRWKYSIGKSFPDNAYFYFVCAHRELDSFRWFISMLKDVDDEYHNMVKKNPEHMKLRNFEFHFWVTSVPKEDQPMLNIPLASEVSFWGYRKKSVAHSVQVSGAGWTEGEMYKLLKRPKSAMTRLGSVRVYSDRPDWDARFNDVSVRHSGSNIGVTFCGNPLICKSLEQMCSQHSNYQSKTFFTLHKENF